jgi:exosortase A
VTVLAAIVPTAGRADPAWRPHLLALGGAVAGLLLLFHRDAADMVRIWLTSSTYNHCALILPIIAWLVWQRRPALDRLAPAAWTPGLLLVAAGAFVWLVGEAGGVALARHLGLVLMLQGAVVACLGKSVSRGLAFPIFYLLFLVPAGDEIVPLMQSVTAELCMALLRLSGIPAHLEGIFITIPSGLFRVAEACAGVKFLVAMVALGALVAHLCFRSWKRRALFMLASVAIPILANGVRAWGTIYIAHVTDSDFAAGVDHVVYGWIFFAIVIALTLGAGWRFFDRAPGDPWFDPEDLRARPGKPQRAVQFAAAALAIAAAPPLWSAALAAGSQAPSDIAMPTVPGWQRVAGDLDWKPHFAGAARLRIGRYRDATGREVDLAIAVFARQSEGREMVGFGQGAVGPDGDWTRIAATPPPSNGRSERIGSRRTVREVATFYRVGDLVTGSEYRVKLETMKTRLLGGPQRAVAILVSAKGRHARSAIDAFLGDLGPVAPLADRAAGA